MKPESDRPITIEDLLRLKRAEVPPAEFWSTFDRELRAKQLAALLPKRRWWQTLPASLARLPRSRYRVPLGASVVLAITFFSVRDDKVLPAMEQVAAASETVAAEISQSTEPTVEIVAAPSVAVASPAIPSIAAQDTSPAIAATSSTSPAQLEVSRVMSPPVPVSVARDAESPSARRIAANLAAVQSPEVLNARTLLAATNSTGFEARVMPQRTAVEPLQQMTPPSDTRRSRLLTAMVSTASLDTSTHTTARAASRIDEERLYDQIQRFGARGDRVQMKF